MTTPNRDPEVSMSYEELRAYCQTPVGKAHFAVIYSSPELQRIRASFARGGFKIRMRTGEERLFGAVDTNSAKYKEIQAFLDTCPSAKDPDANPEH